MLDHVIRASHKQWVKKKEKSNKVVSQSKYKQSNKAVNKI